MLLAICRARRVSMATGSVAAGLSRTDARCALDGGTDACSAEAVDEWASSPGAEDDETPASALDLRFDPIEIADPAASAARSITAMETDASECEDAASASAFSVDATADGSICMAAAWGACWQLACVACAFGPRCDIGEKTGQRGRQRPCETKHRGGGEEAGVEL